MARPVHTATRLLLAALLVVAGIAMLVLPGPGILTIALGIGLAGRTLDWPWARRVERRIRRTVRRHTREVGSAFGPMDTPSLSP